MAREIQLSKSEKRKKRHNHKGVPVSYAIGTLVLVGIHRLSSAIDRCIQKFYLLYEGPYEIAEIKAGNAYVVVDIVTKQIYGTFNVIFLRKYILPTTGSPVPRRINKS